MTSEALGDGCRLPLIGSSRPCALCLWPYMWASLACQVHRAAGRGMSAEWNEGRGSCSLRALLERVEHQAMPRGL